MAAADPALRRLTEQVLGAKAHGTPLSITGGGTKSFYGEAPRGERLEVGALSGISSYEPSELVVSARAGTTLAAVEAAIGEAGQCLPFEPPRFAPGGTIGGMVAAGLTGPARASAGSLRDYCMGVSLLNGRGELLHFGGQVMKNVAGYDVSRLLAGSWGILGILCEVSLKVMPQAPATTTLSFECDEPEALARLRRWSSEALPLTASSWQEDSLKIRLAGAAAAVRAAESRLGGTALDSPAATDWWAALRDQTYEFFRPSPAELAAGEALWRISVPVVSAPLVLPGRQLIEWGGALRWWRTRLSASEVRAGASRAGGHATLVRAADKSAGAFARPSEAIMRLHRRLKSAFDPAGIFNPGRLYADL
jgi:FAD/FMN-containing dehydrogenase